MRNTIMTVMVMVMMMVVWMMNIMAIAIMLVIKLLQTDSRWCQHSLKMAPQCR